MSQSTDFQTALNTSTKHKLGLTGNIIIDTLNDGVMITVSDAGVVSIANDGTITQAQKVTETVTLDLSKITKAMLAGMVASLMLDNIRALKAVEGISEHEHKMLNAEHIAGRFLNEVIPVIQGKVSLAETSIYVVAEGFNFKKFGLDPDLFASGNKSTYALPKNQGVKAYLKAEHKRMFDDLADEGLLCANYGRNLVKEGDFAGYFAVLIPPAMSKVVDVPETSEQ